MSTIDWEGVKARHRMSEVARRSGLDVGETGRAMVSCPTPDHPDATPSTLIDLDRGRFHCFGCDAHGDVIDWVRAVEGVDTATAVSILDSGRPIHAVLSSSSARHSRGDRPADRPQPDRTPPARVLAANETAWQYYSCTALHERGVQYLASREVDVGALENEVGVPVIGHTPSSKTRIDGLVGHLTARGFSETEMLDAGIAHRLADGCVIDFFRDRAILPIRNDDDAVIGLAGRDITAKSPVKYLNPPTTATYHKSRALYRPSRRRLQPDASVVITEGPLDALAVAAVAATSGHSNRFAPVAACGTALSDAQIDHILAIHPRAPVLAADGDQAGRRADLDWARRMLSRGRETVITDWPEGYDPLDWLTSRGTGGLLAVSRRGCLEDRSGRLRPRHCGAVITEADFPYHDPSQRPERAVFQRSVAAASAPLPPRARQRYLAAATSVFALSPPENARTSPLPGAFAIAHESPVFERISL